MSRALHRSHLLWRWLAVGLMFILLSVGLVKISKAPCFQLIGSVTCRAETTEKIVALSFDDGPTPEGVDAVLPELEKRGLHATFFLIGDRMEKWPGQAERLVAAGHELANHSYSHKRMIGASQTHYKNELRRTETLLAKAGAKPSGLFRPPFGKRLIGLPLAVEQSGLHMTTWDVADDVAHHPNPQNYARDIVSRVKPGSIILIHPMYRTNEVERTALPLVLDGLKERGFKIVPVGTLLKTVTPD